MADEKYCTLLEVKLSITGSGIEETAAYDAQLDHLILRASRLIDRYTKREPGAYAVATTDEETRYFNGSGEIYQWVDEMAAAPSAVAVAETGGRASSDYTAYASTDYMLWPYNATQVGQPYRRIDLDVLNGNRSAFYRFPQSVRITAAWGFSTFANMPDEINQACIIQVARWFARARQGFQDTGAVVELGQLRFTARLDPEVAEILDHFKRIVI